MGSTLLEIWKDQAAFIEGKSFRQVIQLAGDGRLRDGNQTSAELREWLAAIPLDHLRQCVEECLSTPFEDAALALQDAANEIGVRLGFSVRHGRYRGVKGENGYDGLWQAKDGFALLLEVKTTDTYRINLDTIAGYRNQLVAAGQVERTRSSILIGVGRQDTGDLEAQIRGSQHAWDIRLISIDGLLRLAAVKEELSDWETSNKINKLLRPVEYTRLDGIVELLFAAKRDLETPPIIAPPSGVEPPQIVGTVNSTNLEAARDSAVNAIGKRLSCTFVRQGRALRASSDGARRLVCLTSQRYQGPSGSANYWYGFTSAQREYLAEVGEGWVGLVCGDSGRTFLIPWKEFSEWLPDFLTTPPAPVEPGEVRHWHVYFNDYGSHVDLMKSGGGLMRDIRPFQLVM